MKRIAILAFLVVFASLCHANFDQYQERNRLVREIEELDARIASYEPTLAQKAALQQRKDEIEDAFADLVDVSPHYGPKRD